MFFFFKQETAYGIRLSLVGSEMCIRDGLCVTLVASPTIVANYGAADSSEARISAAGPVSYIHLTRPTKREGVVSGGGVL